MLETTIPPGRWQVDESDSTATFSARGVWGALAVSGGFSSLSGSVAVEADGGCVGALVIPTPSLSTGLRFRDKHLKSAEFFDVKRYPHIGFTVHALTSDGLRGTLTVRDRSKTLSLPVNVRELKSGRVELTTEAEFDREELGVGRSPLGAIRGPATVRVRVVLSRLS